MAFSALLTILSLFSFPPLEMAEMKLYDTAFRIRGPLKPPAEVIIATIDEKSLEKLGRWPWNRKILAQLVDRLAAAEAAVIAFDIILAEKEENDPILAASIASAGNVILPSVFDFSSSNRQTVTDPLSGLSSFQIIHNLKKFDEYQPITATRVLSPVKILVNSAMAVSPINIFPDSDGTVRWESMAIAFNGRIYPSLPLMTASAFLGTPFQKIALDATRAVETGSIRIPTDRWGRTLINYYGPGETFTHISICDILDGKVAPDLLANRVVLVGATAVGIYDLRVTPYSAAMPGVEKHASVIASIIENRFIRNSSHYLNFLILSSSGLLLTFLMTRLKLAGAVISTLLISAAVYLLSFFLFSYYGTSINIAAPLGNLLCIFIGITGLSYAVEEQRARKIRSMFSSYVSRTVVNELISNPEMAKLGGERREVTILFSDIKDFTSFAEKHTPEEVVAILNEYLGTMTDIILKWDGTLDKFIGDAIVVFWGAPLSDDCHAEKGVRCALEMSLAMGELRRRWQMEGKPLLEAGIGINTGSVLVGNIGAEGKKMDYTIIGDQVNLCSRVESLTRRYDLPLLVTGQCVDSLMAERSGMVVKGLLVRGVERVIVKGREEPVDLFTVEELQDSAAPSILIASPDDKVTVMTEK